MSLGIIASSYVAPAGGASFVDEMGNYSWYSWLRLGESSGTVAEDNSGNNRDGTYVGSPTLGATGLVVGDADTAVNCSTTSKYITQPCDTSSGFADACTFVFGIQTTRTSTTYLMANGTSARIAVPMEGSTGRVRADVYLVAGAYGGPAVNDGSPHLIVATYESTDGLRVFVDGVQVDYNNGDDPENLEATTSFNRRLSNSLPGVGVYDELAVGGFVLTPTQIADLSDAFFGV